MASGCKACQQKCGKGKSTPKGKADATKKALCKILCVVRMEMCQGKHKGKKASNIAEKRARADAKNPKTALGKATKGKNVAVNKGRYVKYPGAKKSWGRSPLGQAALDRQLDKIERQIKKKAAKVLATKAAKKAATVWIKFVPILNVASTVYDVYDLASTGADIYKQIQNARSSLKGGDVYRTRPDVAIQGKNGKLEKIYDFKFDGDKWQPGQKEMYDKDLKDSGAGTTAEEVNSQNCGCDGPKTVARTG